MHAEIRNDERTGLKVNLHDQGPSVEPGELMDRGDCAALAFAAEVKTSCLGQPNDFESRAGNERKVESQKQMY